MARHALNAVVRNAVGVATGGAPAHIYTRGTTVDVTAYDDETAGAPVASVITDSLGRVRGPAGQQLWVNPAKLTIHSSSGAFEDLPYDAVSFDDIGGRMLDNGYAEVSGTDYTSMNAALPGDDVPGATITVIVGVRPIKVEARCGRCYNATAAKGVTLAIYEGATQIAVDYTSADAAQEMQPMTPWRVLTPTVGSHTYRVTQTAYLGGTSHVDTANSRCMILATEL